MQFFRSRQRRKNSNKTQNSIISWCDYIHCELQFIYLPHMLKKENDFFLCIWCAHLLHLRFNWYLSPKVFAIKTANFVAHVPVQCIFGNIFFLLVVLASNNIPHSATDEYYSINLWCLVEDESSISFLEKKKIPRVPSNILRVSVEIVFVLVSVQARVKFFLVIIQWLEQ